MIPVQSGRDHTERLELSCDVVVVGSGASGAVVACTMAEAGYDVLVLEEGPFVPYTDYGAMRPSESLRYTWRGAAVTVAYGLGDTPHINMTMGRVVGGSSVLTGGVCFRVPPSILHRWRTERGIAEMTEEELEPYYQEVETAVHVEEVPEEMRSRSTKLFVLGAARRGIEMRPMKRNTEGCNGCGRCNFGCPHGAKLSVDLTYLPRAAHHGARILADCLVDRVTMKGDRAVGVTGRLLNGKHGKPGSEVVVHARRVVLAAGAAFTPLLLKRSGVHGVSGQVGKNVTVHPGFRTIALFDDKVEGWKGAMQSAYGDVHDPEGLTLTSLFIPPAVLAATMPGVGPELMRRAQNVPYLALFGGIIHDEGGGRVWPGLGREPILTYRMARHDRALIPALVRIMGEAFFAVGAKEIYIPVLGAPPLDADAFRAFPFETVKARDIECSSQHPLGSCRMGKTREHSVVDPLGKVWDTRELYVVDGSIVPTSLGVNPQLTIMTLATRIAHRLRETPLAS
ncbi:MAG: GMC family oxidoreductase [Myxococcales bacterium]|jgi:choline dehydrogenase-like flavoprotein|nr:GMC family oxidoreductase [Myxococcales bacterium]